MGARPYRAAPRWYGPAALVAVLLLVGFRWWSTFQTATPSPGPPLLSAGEYTAARAVDGDTLELVSGERIRLLGVNTPETVAPNRPVEPWGPEAAAFSQAFVAAGPVRLTFDQERHDRYGRHLAYAWRGDTLLNEELIRAGLSEAVTIFPYSRTMKDRFLAAQRLAKRERRGIWSDFQQSPPAATVSP
ncbi:MAG: hypothetical protein C0483_14480 [Pirellula sp.]|nr:hypothetical protein [Pirellula sp.]